MGSVTVATGTYRVQLSDHHVARHLPGVRGVSHVLEALGGVPACLLPQHLLPSGVLGEGGG